MKCFLVAVAILFACEGCSAIQAGIYIPGQTPEFTIKNGRAEAMPFDQFRLVFLDAQAIAMNKPSPARQRCQQERDRLLAKGVEDLNELDLAALSGDLIRLREEDKALEILRTAQKKFPQSFLIQIHLAFVYHLKNDPEAPRYQLEALQLRPKHIPGLQGEQTAWALRLERLFLKLETERLREQQEKGLRAAHQNLDSIFPVQFVGESGQYEPGKIAAEEQNKLPGDALAIVQQFVLWLPEDAQLYWLLGEIYNAQGDVNAARTIFNECVDARGFRPELLREHRRVVLEAVAAQPATGFGNVADSFRGNDKSADKGNSWREHPEAFVIVGSIVAVPLLFLIFWQIRLLVRRTATGGECRTKT
ncbi:MAG TPA: tetratricopeptide repeat protein [Gemmataceae bacterium]|nr:tetratricopeptide repeat protein [Gemmataceae bacterium]